MATDSCPAAGHCHTETHKSSHTHTRTHMHTRTHTACARAHIYTLTYALAQTHPHHMRLCWIELGASPVCWSYRIGYRVAFSTEAWLQSHQHPSTMLTPQASASCCLWRRQEATAQSRLLHVRHACVCTCTHARTHAHTQVTCTNFVWIRSVPCLVGLVELVELGWVELVGVVYNIAIIMYDIEGQG